MKIFVSVVSYRDPLLKYTVRSLLENKSPRHDVIVGVFEQTDLGDSLITVDPELLADKRIRYKRIDAIYADGVCWARAINALQVQNEDFFYQVDSHMLFDPDWDRKLIIDWKRGQSRHGSNKVIISANCKNYDLDEQGVPVRQQTSCEVTCKMKYFVYQMHSDIPAAHGELIGATPDIENAIHICAGNFFTHISWLKDVGLPSDLFFEGEEHKMTLESFRKGWAMFHPRSIHCYHYLKTNDYITKHWHKPIIPTEKWSLMIDQGIKRWQRYLDDLDDEFLEQYHAYSGLDYLNKRIDERAMTYQIIAAPPVETPLTPPEIVQT